MQHTHVQSTIHVPGMPETIKSSLLSTGTSLLQSFKPLNAICNHLFGLHFYSGDMNQQVVAHHFCSHLNEDVQQCVIFDSNEADAKLIGVEYVISEKIFQGLPEDEKKYWHSHVYEVKSGMLVAPQLPNVAEHEVMECLIKTYGKTFHTWQVDKGHNLPLGPPNLMMAFTADGQAKPELLKIRDQICMTTMSQSQKLREDIKPIMLDSAADFWKTGKARVITETQIPMKNIGQQF